MAFIFRNPVLRALEEKLWERAQQRYIDEGGSAIEDIKQLNRQARRQLRQWVKEWRSAEDKKLKAVWREFKRTLVLQTAEALALMLERSDQSWYSVEVGDLPGLPEVLAVPYELLKQRTEALLPELLSSKIAFKGLSWGHTLKLNLVPVRKTRFLREFPSQVRGIR